MQTSKPIVALCVLTTALAISLPAAQMFDPWDRSANRTLPLRGMPDPFFVNRNAAHLIDEGRRIFRYDTFGDEAFWGDTLRLHEAIAGAAHGGVGNGVSPRVALSVGLKVDADALPHSTLALIRSGRVDLDDPATTLALLKANAVVGVTGFFNKEGELRSLGLQCAICHSTVDDSIAPGIGRRLDGWANRDLNVGAIAALAPHLEPVAAILEVDVPTVRAVLNSWGPGKFDAELFLDGKAFNPLQVSHGVVTGKNVPGATMLPNAYGLAGFNQHTWTGAWGTVSYWNAFVANLELRGIGNFFDPRLNDPTQFPVAARTGLGNVRTPPEEDRITAKLPALHFYQLSLPSPLPRPGEHFNRNAARLGEEIFTGKGRCNECHVKPLWTEPGWNLHSPEEIGIDSFQADRAPDGAYKTQNLAGLFIRELGIFMRDENRGRFYHDGRFRTLSDVVEHYDIHFKLDLTPSEKLDLVEYLKSL